jgi:hypothetical protein
MTNESPSSIRIMCPNLTCRKVLAVPHSCRGKTVRCRSCGTNIRVPGPQVEAAPKTAAAPEHKPGTAAA